MNIIVGQNEYVGKHSHKFSGSESGEGHRHSVLSNSGDTGDCWGFGGYGNFTGNISGNSSSAPTSYYDQGKGGKPALQNTKVIISGTTDINENSYENLPKNFTSKLWTRKF